VGGAALQPSLAVILRRADPLFSRILVGTDGSDRATCAIRQAVRLAGLTGAELEIAHVHERSRIPSMPGWRGDPVEESEDLLAEAVRIAGNGRVRPSTTILEGHPSAALAAHASRTFCDLVVLGPDVSFLEKPRMLGGVAAHALRDESCSVLVARPAPDESTFPARILCAVDESEGAREAARQAALLARLTGGLLNVLTVAEDGLAHAVVRAGDDWRADLIVTGASGRHGILHGSTASVSRRVAADARCSVLVARPRPG
jgi:nucleotide-binding universal stress UspA family protein